MSSARDASLSISSDWPACRHVGLGTSKLCILYHFILCCFCLSVCTLLRICAFLAWIRMRGKHFKRHLYEPWRRKWLDCEQEDCLWWCINIKMNHSSNNASHKLEAWVEMVSDNHGQHLCLFRSSALSLAMTNEQWGDRMRQNFLPVAECVTMATWRRSLTHQIQHGMTYSFLFFLSVEIYIRTHDATPTHRV